MSESHAEFHKCLSECNPKSGRILAFSFSICSIVASLYVIRYSLYPFIAGLVMLEAHTIGYFMTEVRIVMGTVYTVLVAVSISRNGDGQAALRPIRYRDWMQPKNRSKVQGCHARHGQRNREVDLMPLRVIESVRSISLHHQQLRFIPRASTLYTQSQILLPKFKTKSVITAS